MGKFQESVTTEKKSNPQQKRRVIPLKKLNLNSSLQILYKLQSCGVFFIYSSIAKMRKITGHPNTYGGPWLKIYMAF